MYPVTIAYWWNSKCWLCNTALFYFMKTYSGMSKGDFNLWEGDFDLLKEGFDLPESCPTVPVLQVLIYLPSVGTLILYKWLPNILQLFASNALYRWLTFGQQDDKTREVLMGNLLTSLRNGIMSTANSHQGLSLAGVPFCCWLLGKGFWRWHWTALGWGKRREKRWAGSTAMLVEGLLKGFSTDFLSWVI